MQLKPEPGKHDFHWSDTRMSEITPEDVERFEKLAGLNLPAGRRPGVAGILNSWIPGANELSQKMSEPQHRNITPNVRFTHPDVDEAIER